MNNLLTSTIVLDNEFATVWHHLETNIVHHRFHKLVYGETFRAILKAGLAIMYESRASKWLSDEGPYLGLLPEDETWVQTILTPQAVEAGWKYWAIVLPEKNVHRIMLQRVQDQYTGYGIVTEIFMNADQALRWLESQGESA